MKLYFAGSISAEELLPIIDKSEEYGILFTFFDIPKKRFKTIKKNIKRKEKHENNS